VGVPTPTIDTVYHLVVRCAREAGCYVQMPPPPAGAASDAPTGKGGACPTLFARPTREGEVTTEQEVPDDAGLDR
jgi:hypothetical protein